MESIYGCLERIENKINGLSMPQSAGGDAEADKEVIQELNALKTGFKRVLEALVMIKGDTANLLKRNSMPDKFMETLSVLKSEQQAYHKNQNEFLENLGRKQVFESVNRVYPQGEKHRFGALLRQCGRSFRMGDDRG